MGVTWTHQDSAGKQLRGPWVEAGDRSLLPGRGPGVGPQGEAGAQAPGPLLACEGSRAAPWENPSVELGWEQLQGALRNETP